MKGKAFGTFMFYFLLDNSENTKFITSRTPSAVLMQKIICGLQANNEKNAEIIKLLKYRLGRINY